MARSFIRSFIITTSCSRKRLHIHHRSPRAQFFFGDSFLFCRTCTPEAHRARKHVLYMSLHCHFLCTPQIVLGGGSPPTQTAWIGEISRSMLLSWVSLFSRFPSRAICWSTYASISFRQAVVVVFAPHFICSSSIKSAGCGDFFCGSEVFRFHQRCQVCVWLLLVCCALWQCTTLRT